MVAAVWAASLAAGPRLLPLAGLENLAGEQEADLPGWQPGTIGTHLLGVSAPKTDINGLSNAFE